ncbi:MAG: carboxylating nicotinate-nucleotide diphosphorylase [Dehalococcoidia bacterium]|nr:carboxylating nicotinate-nucleotide diphosphorylase [Dehalococcoidia bacterium]
MGKVPVPEEQIDAIIDLSLAEDLGHGDVTSEILIPPELEGKATIFAREAGILAGAEIAGKVFRRVDSSLAFTVLSKDGAAVKDGDKIAEVSGRVISILKAERTALNFLQRLSGIASLTAKYTAETHGLETYIADTRKTTPGLRQLEKHAVSMGGGTNHRLHLGDGILIKDNHLAALRATGMSLKEIVARAKKNAPKGLKVEAEVTTIDEAKEAAEAGADIIMLDNMSPDEMRQVVKSLKGKVKIEASGGINLSNVRQAALTGVDYISIGALTHSPKSLDISLEFDPDFFKLASP